MNSAFIVTQIFLIKIIIQLQLGLEIGLFPKCILSLILK